MPPPLFHRSTEQADPPTPDSVPLPPPLPPLEGEGDAGQYLSTTVFTGETDAWRRHLRIPWRQRFDADGLQIAVQRSPDAFGVRFKALAGERAAFWVKALNRAAATTERILESRPVVRSHTFELITGSDQNADCPLEIRTLETNPGPATREIRFDTDFQPIEARILLRTALLREVAVWHAEHPPSDDLEHLGVFWPVLRRIYLHLGYPNYPRDRFTERIDITARWVLLNLHLLYEGKRDGRLTPNAAGRAYEGFCARSKNLERGLLQIRQPFFRLLNDVSFLLHEKQVAGLFDTAKIMVRDYLDPRYLRLSISSLMPGIPDWQQPMGYGWKGKRKIVTPSPALGRFGILDQDDLVAWKKVRGPLDSIGYTIIRQLGMGQFGRVYEAINRSNPSIPQRVALKVDRFRKGYKKMAIEASEIIMDIAAGLAASPHMIRIFDAGKLPKNRSTYHVMQIVDGDTLDNLLGITGLEHASVLRPLSPHGSADDVKKAFLTSITASRSELWRRARQAFPFRRRPAIVDQLDLLVSKMLWVEEVHRLGYAVNDLKNGNVMISRRGQFKGIDLDAYSRVYSPLDKLGDFLFLAVATAQLLTAGRPGAESLKHLISDTGELRRFLLEDWAGTEPLPHPTAAAPSAEELASYVCDFVEAARGGEFSAEPTHFSNAIDRLIALKRRLTTEEMVLE